MNSFRKFSYVSSYLHLKILKSFAWKRDFPISSKLPKEISGKSLKFFGPPTTKWRSCKKYETFGLLKMCNMSEAWFDNNKFSLYFLFFQLANDYCQKSYEKTIFFYKGFRGFLRSSATSQIYFDLHAFDNETTALLNFFEISMEIHFLSLFFLNERKVATSLLMIHLKCTVVHYANLNSSSINKKF